MVTKRNAKGEGSFKINIDGTVTHRKSVGYKANGQRKIITVTAANKTACIREMKKKEAQWGKQQAAEKIGSGTTISELCYLHLSYQVDQDELKPKSIDRRECTIGNHIEAYPFGRMQVLNVKVADVDSHVSELVQKSGLSASSIEKVIDVLNAAYNWAIIRGELDKNPVAPIKPTLEKRIQKLKQRTAVEADVDVLSEEEQKIFEREAGIILEKTGKLKYSGGLDSLLLLYTGMRVGEMLALRWKDVDFESGCLTIERSRSMAKNRNKKNEEENSYVMIEGTTKNEKARKIKLTDKALEVLKMMKTYTGTMDSEDFIIRTRTGKPNTTTNVEHRTETIFRNAGLTDLSGGVHILRKTFATRMYENGARVKEIAAYIGDLESTTERYYIAVRKKVKDGNGTAQVVMVPDQVKPGMDIKFVN